jgi:hypothetical protein
MGSVKRTSWSFILVAAAVASLAPPACSNTITTPPELADCVASADASCNAPRGSTVGGGVTIHGDSSTDLDSAAMETADSGTCGQADLTIASNASPAFPACAPCVTAAPGSGASNCCLADSSCDTGCVAILQCVLQNQCEGKPSCVETCEVASTASSIANYNDFGSCLMQICAPQCPSLPPGMAATGDL